METVAEAGAAFWAKAPPVAVVGGVRPGVVLVEGSFSGIGDIGVAPLMACVIFGSGACSAVKEKNPIMMLLQSRLIHALIFDILYAVASISIMHVSKTQQRW